MSHLKKLAIKPDEPLSLRAKKFPQYALITSLDLSQAYMNTYVLNIILKTFPKVWVLSLIKMDDEGANMIENTSKYLKKLTVLYFKAEDLPIENYNRNIEEFSSQLR